MKKIKFLLVFVLLILGACKDYINSVDPFIDRVVDEALNLESQIPLLKEGMITRATATTGYILLMSDGLSDALVWDQRLTQATYTGYRQLEETLLDQNNSETNGTFYTIQLARTLADTLIARVNGMPSLSTAVKTDALYHAYLYSAYTRYLIGTYYGKDENTGGAPINNSHFKSTSVLYADAISRWKEALKNTTNANNIKIVNSLIGRCYLFLADYANAVTHLNLGLVKNDAPFLALYDNVNNENAYRQQASSELRIQWRVDDRFKGYVTAEPTEAKRIKYKNYFSTVMLEQTMYIKTGTTTTPIPLIDWQEAALMKAELIVRGSMSGDALALINDIRTSRSVKVLPAGTNITLNTAGTENIYVERDKELFVRGLRLVDQRRFNSFHNSYGWKYFAIPLAERLKNPNWNN